MNKGYAFGFLLVLLVLGLGFYVAFTSFRSTRAALLAQPTSTARLATSTPRPTRAPTATFTPLPTPIPGITLTLTAQAQPSPTATPKGAKPAKTAKPKKTAAPTPPPATPTVPSVSSFPFRLAAPPSLEMNSGCCYILGTVRDAAGNGMPGVLVQAFNEWVRPPPAESKAGIEAGRYNIPIGANKVTWYVVVVDANGIALSPQASLVFDGTVAPAVRVDWGAQ